MTSYTICLDTINGLKKYGEYPTMNQACKNAVALLKKSLREHGRTSVHIFDTDTWIINRRDSNISDYSLGWVELPYSGTPNKSQLPVYEGPVFWKYNKGVFSGHLINTDGSAGRPFKMTKGGSVIYTDLPKKTKKKDTGMHPFGL